MWGCTVRCARRSWDGENLDGQTVKYYAGCVVASQFNNDNGLGFQAILYWLDSPSSPYSIQQSLSIRLRWLISIPPRHLPSTSAFAAGARARCTLQASLASQVSTPRLRVDVCSFPTTTRELGHFPRLHWLVARRQPENICLPGFGSITSERRGTEENPRRVLRPLSPAKLRRQWRDYDPEVCWCSLPITVRAPVLVTTWRNR